MDNCISKSFSSLELSDFILKACEQVGVPNSCSQAQLLFTSPTPVQLATIPQILSGRNVVAIAPTGSGKTAAYVLPIISELSKDSHGICCLILTSTREFVKQISAQFNLFGSGIKIDVAEIIGGLSHDQQESIIERNPHILVATPGHLLRYLKSATRVPFDHLRFLVLDEIDILFQMNESIWKDIEDIVKYLPETRQTLLYSATLDEKMLVSNILSQPPNVIKSASFQPDEHQSLSGDGNTYFWNYGNL
ncbi:putative ATP-dependent RNA helicase DDX49 [Histomonas meleagridis]|uniref:putative ATP-dependent RNA helicase DDX49 n=1 Tax=Histomonas meleagridis TaxID=135588 RepID=UPI003559DE1A|nr:putative ATP-dependent RNA helicase DDX49 [Histomonas meleagridis]KAH0801661.1 putative ATP-dependent RNA helicase DDX49 [Histomonas meleagridis]